MLTKYQIKPIILLLALSLISLWPINSEATGIGVKPTNIDLKLNSGQTASTELFVKNITDEPLAVKIYSENLSKHIQPAPQEFILEPNASQIIALTVKFTIPGNYQDDLAIVAKPLSGTNLALALGVKVPIAIQVVGLPYWWFVIGLIIISLVYFIFKAHYEEK